MFDESFINQLNSWNEKTLLKKIKFNRGIERETLRVSKDGSISKRPHPKSLGSALTNPYITTDFAEALIELVTPKFDNVDDLYSCLQDLHVFTAQNIDEDEFLWAHSMPCRIDKESDINIASYGSNNSGMLKHIYRKGLRVRYGSIMQCVSGIHYNFSIDEKSYCDLLGSAYSQEAVDNLYLGLIRNFKRNFWFILAQLGASPVADKSYVLERDHNLEKLNANDVFLPEATSLRMSNIGYQSPIQTSLGIRYNSLDGFIESVKKGIKMSHIEFNRLGLFDAEGNRQQISDGIIQIENELYDTIRPKRTSPNGLRPANALKEHGIEYVEIRGVDISPNALGGISKDQMHFLDLFLIHCFITRSSELTDKENIRLQKNHTDMVSSGQNNSTVISYKGKEISSGEAMVDLINELSLLAKTLDGETKTYGNALRAITTNKNQSAAIFSSLAEGKDFHDIALEKSIQNTNELRQNKSLDLNYLKIESEESLKRFQEIEDDPQKDIEAYVEQYNSQI
jgi:glutamate--cysteine ligase